MDALSRRRGPTARLASGSAATGKPRSPPLPSIRRRQCGRFQPGRIDHSHGRGARSPPLEGRRRTGHPGPRQRRQTPRRCVSRRRPTTLHGHPARPIGLAPVVASGHGRLAGPEIDLGSGVNLVTFSPDGRSLVTGCETAEVRSRLWRCNDGKLVRELREHRDRVVAIAFHPRDGTVRDGQLRPYLPRMGQRPASPKGSIFRDSGAIRSVALHPSRPLVLVGGHDRIARSVTVTGRPREVSRCLTRMPSRWSDSARTAGSP